MVGWIILSVLVGLIIILMLIPIGADIRYEDGVIRVSAKVAGLKLQLIPKKKSDKKKEEPKEEPREEKKEKSKEKSEKEKKQKEFPFNLEEIFDLLKVAISGFGRFGRRFRVEHFVLHWTCAGMNPYLNARVFAVVNAGLSQLAPLCSERFHCRNTSVWTDIDFTSEDMFFEFVLTATIRIGQIVRTVLRMAWEALLILLRSKRRRKQEAKEAESEAAALEEDLGQVDNLETETPQSA